MNPAKPQARIGQWLLASIGLCGCAVAHAEERHGGPALTGSIALTSDYRYRGVSYSDQHPALQGGLGLEGTGWFAGAWGSRALGPSRTADEIDLYAGKSGQVGALGYSLTAYAYMDGRMRRIQNAELEAMLWRSVGPISLQVEASVAPKQRETPANLYLGGTATIPLRDPRLSMILHAGRETGFLGRKLDWEAGVAYSRSALTLSASLIGSTRRDRYQPTGLYEGGTGLILSAAAGF